MRAWESKGSGKSKSKGRNENASHPPKKIQPSSVRQRNGAATKEEVDQTCRGES
jgi:hypothetical protein